MKTYNIGGDPNDASYRYKMPEIQVKIEGRGNGIKTIFTNVNDVSKSLNRNTEYVIKWFGYELGSQSTYNKETKIYSINGCHDDLNKLQTILNQFIKKYVLCPNCKLPETYLKVINNNIESNCNACGAVKILNDNHKIKSVILKTPPIQQVNIKTKTHKSEQKILVEDNDEWSIDLSSEAVEKRRLEQLSTVMRDIVQK